MNNKKDNGSALYNNEHVFVKIEWGHKRVCIHDIVYLEAQQNYCVIHLLKGNEKSRMMVTVPMCEVLEDLNPDLFSTSNISTSLLAIWCRWITAKTST